MDGLLPFPSLDSMNIMVGVSVVLMIIFVLVALVVAIRCNDRSYNLLLWGTFSGLVAVLCNLAFYFYAGNHAPVLMFYLSVFFACVTLLLAVAGIIKVLRRKNSRG